MVFICEIVGGVYLRECWWCLCERVVVQRECWWCLCENVGGVYLRESWWCLCESGGADRALVVFM